MTAPAFAQLTQWAQQRAELIDSCENVIWRDKRYFHGFLYWPDGQRHLYANASLTCVMQQAYALQAAGVPCTPIQSKHYWFDAHKDWSIAKWRSQFAADLTQLMDPEALQRFQALRQLPSPISAQQFHEARRAIDSQRYPLAAQVLAYYDSLWG